MWIYFLNQIIHSVFFTLVQQLYNLFTYHSNITSTPLGYTYPWLGATVLEGMDKRHILTIHLEDLLVYSSFIILPHEQKHIVVSWFVSNCTNVLMSGTAHTCMKALNQLLPILTHSPPRCHIKMSWQQLLQITVIMYSTRLYSTFTSVHSDEILGFQI